jgi:hypothetical protein
VGRHDQCSCRSADLPAAPSVTLNPCVRPTIGHAAGTWPFVPKPISDAVCQDPALSDLGAAYISVHSCSSLAMAIVTHLVTRFTLRVLVIQAALASADGKTTETHAEPSKDSCDDRETHAPALSRLEALSEWARW